jgi:pimeloyl-ACP methyl ester carboxylesterase
MKSAWINRSIALPGLCFFLAAAQEPPQLPPPLGRLIDVGGHRVHLYCTGQGSPTVIVVGGFSFDWDLVQPEIAKLTRICTYDVSGTAWSDRGPASTCPDRTAEIRALLHNAGIKGPFVFTGHSVGGLVSRYYAGQYPGDVAGMVIVDHAFTPRSESLPRSVARHPTGTGDSPPALIEMTPLILTTEETSDFNKLPENIRELHRWAASRKPALNQADAADDCESRLQSEGSGASSLSSIPLVVVSTANEAPGYAKLQSELLALSRNSIQMMANRSFHSVEIDQPDVVINAIRKVVDEIRQPIGRVGKKEHW